MPLLEPLFQISKICSLKNILDAVISPGSRSAALTLAFSRNPDIVTTTIADERSAAFYALGLSSVTSQTTVLICTSGSAALNYAPAIAEAYFQEVPLLILTADRPPEWIHQYDGQTIFQENIYGNHVKKSFQLPADYHHPDSKWHINRVVNEAIDLCQKGPKGPVHINIPIREPFYPDHNQKFDFDLIPRIIESYNTVKTLDAQFWSDLMEIWRNCDSKLVAIGQNNEDLDDDLEIIAEEENCIVLSDIISNVKISQAIKCHDLFLPKIQTDSLDMIPDLLITAGKSFISKSFKEFVRKNPPKFHWHIQDNPEIIDPTKSLTHKIEVSPVYFFNELVQTLEFEKIKTDEEGADTGDFKLTWTQNEHLARKYINRSVFVEDFTELLATSMIFETLPPNCGLHLGNSMPVRYANHISVLTENQPEVFANRGTSGIDGTISTSIGQATKHKGIFCCISGDVAFFYDSNALFINQLPQNFRCVVINNGGGNIFRIIDGPNKQPELDMFFVTDQKRNAASLCKEAGIDYHKATNSLELSEILKTFFEENHKTSLLEIFTDGQNDAAVFKSFKSDFTL